MKAAVVSRRRVLFSSALLFTVLFMALLITQNVAADTVFFGRYLQKQVPQNSDEENYLKAHGEFENGVTVIGGVRYGSKGDYYYKDTPIEWYIIEDDGSDFVLLSKYVLDFSCFQYSSDGMNVFWDRSVLRSFLNNEFYNKAFTSSEQGQIIPTTVSTEEYTYESIYIVGDRQPTIITTTDKVFALSGDEITGGRYAVGTGVRKGIPSPYIDPAGAPLKWYLRGPCDWYYGNPTILFVNENEQIDWWYGTYTYGVRPCIRVSKSAPGLFMQDPGTEIPTGSFKHNWETAYTVDVPATCTKAGSKSIHCSRCDAIKEGSEAAIPATGHSFGTWVTTKAATESAEGEQTRTCSECGKKETKKIDKLPKTVPVKPVSIRDATVKVSKTSCIYTGKAIKPAVTVKLGKKKLKANTDYTVTYKNNKAVGDATVLVKGKGKYTGTVKTSFMIIPKKMAIISLKSGKKRLTVKWKKQASITGYEIQYSRKKDLSDAKRVVIKNPKTTAKIIKNLKGGKKYYVRIQSYKYRNKIIYFSGWSKVRAVTVKK